MMCGRITLYNCAEQGFRKVLLPKLLDKVHVESVNGAGKAADGDSNADSLLVIIPFSGRLKGFKKPIEYSEAEDKTGIWTIAVGDIITLDDTGAAESYEELTGRTQTYRITSVKTFPFGGLPHWEVTAV